jgi:hypothetical protein
LNQIRLRFAYPKLNVFIHESIPDPHGTRDKQDVPDTAGNILIDCTLPGFENDGRFSSPIFLNYVN